MCSFWSLSIYSYIKYIVYPKFSINIIWMYIHIWPLKWRYGVHVGQCGFAFVFARKTKARGWFKGKPLVNRSFGREFCWLWPPVDQWSRVVVFCFSQHPPRAENQGRNSPHHIYIWICLFKRKRILNQSQRKHRLL